MNQVNVIDNVVLTQENDKTKVYAQWSALDPEITVYTEFSSGQAVKLYLNWSDKNGTIPLQPGDYFTFVISDIFNYIYVHNVDDIAIMDEYGEVVATYSIYDNNNMKEIKITFTDYVETHTNISGDYWILLFIGQVNTKEVKDLEFIVNGDLIANGQVTINPKSTLTPRDNKVGFSLPTRSAGGYYIFEWIVYVNMGENTSDGFDTLENYSFEDIIPIDSPHMFLTDEIRQKLGLSSAEYKTEIGEYLGADTYPPENRYQIFLYHYNCTDNNIWYNFIHWDTMVDGLTTIGIDGDDGLNVSDINVTDKIFSAALGTITRPTSIRFYTISTVKLAESALGDTEVVKLYQNTFKGISGKVLNSVLTLYRFESGGSAQGITGDYNFSFTKVNENDIILSGALFSLYISDNLSIGADRLVYSNSDGVVSFIKLPVGTYYVQETLAPSTYISNDTIYKVVLESKGYEIYYGDNFENKLSDQGNKIINKLETRSCSIILTGTKNLTGQTMSSNMFRFVVNDSKGMIAATGTNALNGNITFTEIEFDSPGEYIFTIEEIAGGYSGYIYDDSKFTVTVTVTEDEDGKLKAEAIYPDKGVVFNNSYAPEKTKVILTGLKNLIGRTMTIGIFSFVVRNSVGEVVAIGTNAFDGSITFSEIEFDLPGEYTFTVEEIAGGYSGYTYDSSKYTVTVKVTADGEEGLKTEVVYPDKGIIFNNSYTQPPAPSCRCIDKSMKCRKTFKGKKIWIDNENEGATRPATVEIVLIRDNEIYDRKVVDSTGDGTFAFYCKPIYRNSSQKYIYRIDEINVPDDYTKTIDGYNVINTLNP